MIRRRPNPSRFLSLVLRSATLVAVALVLSFTAVRTAVADDAKIDGLWVPNIIIDSIDEGRLIYSVQGQEVRRPIEEVTGLKMQVYPELGQAVDLIEADKPADALPLLRKVQTDAREPWLKSWVKRMLVDGNDAAGKPVDAVNLFIELSLDPTTEPTYLTNPPLRSLVKTTDAQRTQLAARVKDAIERSKSVPAKASLQMIATALATVSDAMAEGTPIDITTMPELGAAPSKSLTPMPRRVIEDEKDPIAGMLREGKYDEALAEADAQLSRPTATMARLLYLKGLAQLYIAERSSDQTGYKDAGLSFMRVVAYFRNSTQWTIPSYLELAYIHQKIGRPELAQRLLDEGVGVLLDPESDPELYERYRKIAGLKDEPAPADDASTGN